MPDTGEALKIWQALRPMVDKEIAEQTESCVRAKKMIVKQATVQNEDGSVSLGVAEPYNDKVMIPSGEELANVNPGSPVWVYWYFNNASTMHVALNGDGTQGSAVTDRLLEMLNKEIADREKADKELQSYIDNTASHLRVEFNDGLNSLRSYVELTSSELRLEFHDDLNGLRSYLEMTASHLRIEFYDDLNGLRSYLEMTASHLRAEFYDDMNSLRSYLELTASHLRAEFYDDMNSLRSYLELTASHLRAEFYDDVNSLRSYLELTASHLRTEFYDDVNSLRSYVEITASHLRADYYNDMASLRSYIEIQAGLIAMNVAATDENASILRQAGMYINDQGVLVYATDNQNNIGSKLAVMSNEISAKVGKSEITITDDSITIGSDTLSLEGYVTATQLASQSIYIGTATITNLTSSYATLDGRMGTWQTPTMDSASVSGTVFTASTLNLGHYHSITTSESGGVVTITLGAAQSSQGQDSFNIAATQFYRDGVAAAAAGVTLSGSWSSAQYTATASNGRSVSSGYVYIAGSANNAYFGSGTNLIVVADIVSGGTTIRSSDTTSINILSTLQSATTLTDSGWSNDQTTVTAKVNGTTIKTLTLTAPSTTQRTANYVLGTVTSAGYTAGTGTGTATIQYNDGTSTTGVLFDVYATPVYNAGYNAGRNSVTISSNDIVITEGPSYQSASKTLYVEIEAYASNGESGTKQFYLDAEDAYNAGQNSVYVSSWSVDKSNLPTVTVTVTLSNGVVRSHSFNV